MSESLKKIHLDNLLNPEIDNIILKRYNTSFRGYEYQQYYCNYHKNEYVSACRKHNLAKFGNSEESEQLDSPQYYRIAFEAHCFGFFRTLHSLIESIPYMLNIVLEINSDIEGRNVNWFTIESYCDKHDFERGKELIKDIRKSKHYARLSDITNISKHRRIPKINSNAFYRQEREYCNPVFCKDDLCEQYDTYNIEKIMIETFNELHPKTIHLIDAFIQHHYIK